MHPFDKTDPRRQTYLDREKLAHIVLDYWWEGNVLWGTVETAATRAGRDFQGLIRQGCQVSMSMRGLGGKVSKRGGYEYIDDNLFIYCYDNVDFPSHEIAYLQRILKEETEANAPSNLILQEDSTSQYVSEILNESSITDISSHEEDKVRSLIEGENFDYAYRDKFYRAYCESIACKSVDNFLINL